MLSKLFSINFTLFSYHLVLSQNTLSRPMPFLPEAHSQMLYSISLIAPLLPRRNLYQFQPLFTSPSCSILLLLFLSSCRILNRIVYIHFPNVGFCYCFILSSFSRHFPKFQLTILKFATCFLSSL